MDFQYHARRPDAMPRRPLRSPPRTSRVAGEPLTRETGLPTSRTAARRADLRSPRRRASHGLVPTSPAGAELIRFWQFVRRARAACQRYRALHLAGSAARLCPSLAQFDTPMRDPPGRHARPAVLRTYGGRLGGRPALVTCNSSAPCFVQPVAGSQPASPAPLRTLPCCQAACFSAPGFTPRL